MDPSQADVAKTLLARRDVLLQELAYVNAYLANLGVDPAGPPNPLSLSQNEVDEHLLTLLQGAEETKGMTPTELARTLVGQNQVPIAEVKRLVLAGLERLQKRSYAYRGPGNRWRVRAAARALSLRNGKVPTNGHASVH